VVPEELVIDVTKGIQQTENAGYGLDALQRLGRRLHADYVISGSYLVSPEAGDPKLRIDVVVHEVRTGNAVARFSKQNVMSALPDLVSQTGSMLRTVLGVPAPSSETLTRISNAQPSSVDVAQKLTLARQSMQNFDAAHAGRAAKGSRMSFAISTDAQRLELTIGPFVDGSGEQLSHQGPDYSAASALTMLSDELDVRREDGAEVLHVVMIDRRRSPSPRD
jgi:hypothetical protein